MQLGMIGLGRMGANMTMRLMKAGQECVVYDSPSGASPSTGYAGGQGLDQSAGRGFGDTLIRSWLGKFGGPETPAVEALRPRGSCGIVGVSKPGTNLQLDVNDLMQNCKLILGIIEGDSVPDIFIPHLVDLYMQGRFPFEDKLVKFYTFDKINEAAEDAGSWRDGRTGQSMPDLDPYKGLSCAGSLSRSVRSDIV